MLEEKDAISSPEDDSSADGSPSRDGNTITVELPVDNFLPKWWMFGQHMKSRRGKGQCLALLTCQLMLISLHMEPEVPVIGPVDIPGSLISTLMRDPPKRSLGDELTAHT